ncbi:MAG: hypothetical protein H7196_03780 [candidate division SR1 bacterium]|nr:hypothetical protein [candidate division SR1 bacterium]
MGLTKLTSSSYPNEFFLYAACASGIYLTSILASKTTKMIPVAIISFVTTTISYSMVALLLFNGNFLFLQIITLVFLAFQVIETFIASKEYFSKNI